MYDLDELDKPLPHLLTNFPLSELGVYQKAVKEFGDTTLYIDTGGECSCGKGYSNLRNSNQGSLMCNRRGDRSDFWRVFDRIMYGHTKR
jgi:hypothetical protein